MGQYYKVVNKTKKEFLDPHSFGHGAKLMVEILTVTIL